MIPTASYYVTKRDKEIRKAIIYDRDGNELREVPLDPLEFNYSAVGRIDKMLDPEFDGKARPKKIVVGYHIKLGRTIFFFDKNGNSIAYQAYQGPLDLAGLVRSQREGQYSIRVDYQWILENDVPVSDEYSTSGSKCRLM